MPSEILLYIVFGISSIALIGVILIRQKINKFFKKDDGNIETLLSSILDELKNLTINNSKTQEEIQRLISRNKKSIKGVEAMRYNPFKNQGGNQSFSVALVDEEANGVIVSSLYSRERNNFFLKPIREGQSEYELTEEEKMVLKKAIEKTK